MSDQQLLPPEIRELMKRKSSRDPESRFANKLHTLLNFVGSDPEKQETFGIGWINESEFRMNKKKLIPFIEIKLNTLNVNLKALGFKQVEQESGGWTRWKKDGFTVTEIADPGVPKSEAVQKEFTDDTPVSNIRLLKDIKLGNVENPHMFKKITLNIWEELLSEIEVHNEISAALDQFLSAAAKRFRESKQTLSNAETVLRAIVLTEDPTQISLVEFTRLMAIFGPEETLMKKVGSLISASNSNSNWFSVRTGAEETIGGSDYFGCYDEREFNCVLYRGDGKIHKVWNIPTVDSTQLYMVDEMGSKYGSWKQYFEEHPQTMSSMYMW